MRSLLPALNLLSISGPLHCIVSAKHALHVLDPKEQPRAYLPQLARFTLFITDTCSWFGFKKIGYFLKKYHTVDTHHQEPPLYQPSFEWSPQSCPSHSSPQETFPFVWGCLERTHSTLSSSQAVSAFTTGTYKLLLQAKTRSPKQ